MKKLIVVAVVLLCAPLVMGQGYDGQKVARTSVAMDTIVGSSHQWGGSLEQILSVAEQTSLDSGAFMAEAYGQVTLSPGQRLYIALDKLTPDSASSDTGLNWTYLEVPSSIKHGTFTFPIHLQSDFMAVDSNVVVDSIGLFMASGQSTDNIVVKNVVLLLKMLSGSED